MSFPSVSRWLSLTNGVYFSIYVSVAAFSTYFCMYAFRRPFTAATYDGMKLWGVDYKIVLIIAQVIGYTLSKFVGIKYISEVKPHQRVASIIVLIGVAELALLFVGLVPYPYNFVFMFFNGLPLGMIWGLVFSFVEGRRNTELTAACLSASFIISSFVVKAIGLYTMTEWGVSEFWMPFVTGAIFFGPMLFFVAMLSQIPKPDEDDVAHRTERVPMMANDRKRYLRNIALGMGILIVLHMMLTAYRDVRDKFAVEILSSFGRFEGHENVDDLVKYLSFSEIPVALVVLAALGSTIVIINNKLAFGVIHGFMFCGVALVGISTMLLQNGVCSPQVWFILVGTGLYLAYVPYHSMLFERLIAVFRDKANAGYLIYIADATGYLASVSVLLYKNFGVSELSWKEFFVSGSYALALTGGCAIVLSYLYFMRKAASHTTGVVREEVPQVAIQQD